MVRGVALAAALLIAPLASAGDVTADAPYTIARSAVSEVAAPDGHRYRLFVAWPEGEPPVDGWPVLYLLDGADNFAVATETARRLARAGARSGIAQGIIVGIDSGPLARRVLDYTPPAPGYAIPAGAPAHGLKTGGAERFLDLVANTVQPRIAARWRVDPARTTLAGHSFGGVLALHALFTRPAVATRYAAVSPSFWYGGSLLTEEAARAQPASRRLLIAAAASEGGPGADAGTGERMVAGLIARGAEARILDLPGQSHGTTMLAAMGEIIRLAFGTDPVR